MNAQAPVLLDQGQAAISFGLVAIVFFVTAGVVLTVTILATMFVRSTSTYAMMSLKKAMVERGMTVDEIERVLAAGAGQQIQPPRSSEIQPPAKPHAGPMYWPAHSHN